MQALLTCRFPSLQSRLQPCFSILKQGGGPSLLQATCVSKWNLGPADA